MLRSAQCQLIGKRKLECRRILAAGQESSAQTEMHLRSNYQQECSPPHLIFYCRSASVAQEFKIRPYLVNYREHSWSTLI